MLSSAANPVPRTGDDRTAILVSDKVDAQAMIEILGILSKLQIDVGQIGTRMTDAETPPGEMAPAAARSFSKSPDITPTTAIETAVSELESRTAKNVTVLGSYPAVWKPKNISLT